MLKLSFPIAAAALVLAFPAAPAAAALGPDAARCRSGSSQPAFLVSINGFRDRRGSLRVHVYGGNPADFLVRGKGVRRIDLPLTPGGPMQVCVAVPGPGTYAIAVRHDADGNGRSSRIDGGGYSNNPHLSLTNLKPPYRRAAVSVGNGVRPVNVTLNYLQGFSVRPIG
jgi:uncharacterized protein (DUF2141 family)